MLEACHPHGDHRCVKTWPKKKSLSHRSMGEQFASFQLESVIKKEFPLEMNKIVII